MTLITGTKQWQVVIRGEVPPGMTDEQCKAMVLNSISTTVQCGSIIRNVDVDVRSSFPQQPGN